MQGTCREQGSHARVAYATQGTSLMGTVRVNQKENGKRVVKYLEGMWTQRIEDPNYKKG